MWEAGAASAVLGNHGVQCNRLGNTK
jgi:hypothetical protein